MRRISAVADRIESMRIFIASDSYKGCMSSSEANRQIEKGIRKVDPSIRTDAFTISDGGEGFVDAWAQACKAQIRRSQAKDLYGRDITACWAYDEKTQSAVIEAACVLGLTLCPRADRRPMEASSYGLGLLCKTVLSSVPVKKLIIGLGGTGTNDGGMGFLEAFGARYFDRSRRPIRSNAGNFSRIAFIDKREFRFPGQVELIAACDVLNPFTGPDGATCIFGKQKGLRPAQIASVEKGMRYFAAKLEQTFHVQLEGKPSAGAAGGLGGMLGEVFGARLVSGIDLLASQPHMLEKLSAADLVITGEGQSDAQSADGKAVARIARLAKQRHKPVVVISGALGIGYEKLYACGVDAMFSTADRAMSFVQALACGPQKLERETENIIRLILACSHMDSVGSCHRTKKDPDLQ